MNAQKKQALWKAMRYWAASYAIVAGFLYYKSNVTLGSVLLAGILTFAVTVGRTFISRNDSDPS